MPVDAIGLSSLPNSMICISPRDFPKLFNECTAAGTFCRKRLDECGSTIVRPVLMGPSPGLSCPSPLMMVEWPTFTPSTSVMELFSPRGNNPRLIPRSDALGLDRWSPEVNEFSPSPDS